jgi:hypothetical protein
MKERHGATRATSEKREEERELNFQAIQYLGRRIGSSLRNSK